MTEVLQQTYLWGYPAVSFESIRLVAKQDLDMDFNDLGIADNFVDPNSVWLTANDTTIMRASWKLPDVEMT